MTRVGEAAFATTIIATATFRVVRASIDGEIENRITVKIHRRDLR